MSAWLTGGGDVADVEAPVGDREVGVEVQPRGGAGGGQRGRGARAAVLLQGLVLCYQAVPDLEPHATHTTHHTQHTTRNTQHTTRNTRHTTRNTRHTKHTTHDIQNTRHTAYNT